MRLSVVLGLLFLAYGVVNVASFLFLAPDNPILIQAQEYPTLTMLEAGAPLAIGVYLTFIRKPKQSKTEKTVEPNEDEIIPQFG